MLPTAFLKRYAPSSLILLYRPEDTGSPGHDISEHISRFSAHRIDLEETQLVGGRVIGHIEHDLGPADEAELQSRICTISYAERKLESNPNAVEFVRVIKECAGDTDPRSLQIWASWAYDEIHNAVDLYDKSSGLTPEEHKTRVVTDVLTKLGRMAMELTAVTATSEEQLLEEPEVYEYFGPQHCYTDGDDETERENLYELRCRELLDKQDTTNPFTAELNFIKSKISHPSTAAIRRSDSEMYESHLLDEGISAEVLETMVEDFERVTEQYTEDGATSLHMSDGERFIVDGTIEEDIDAEYLPMQVAAVVSEVKELFTNGTKFSSEDKDDFTINSFIENQLNRIYGCKSDPEARCIRTIRTIASAPSELITLIQDFAEATRTNLEGEPAARARIKLLMALRKFAKQALAPQYQEISRNQLAIKQAADLAASQQWTSEIPIPSLLLLALMREGKALRTSIETVFKMIPAIAKGTVTMDRPGVYEFEETISIYVNGEERRYCEEVLQQILQNMGRDVILNAQRRSPLFRRFAQTIEAATDTRTLIAAIQEAFQARKAQKLTVKLFTALDTFYQARRATLEAQPLRRNAKDDRVFAEQTCALIIGNMRRNMLRTLGRSKEFASLSSAIEQTSDSTCLVVAIELAKEHHSEGVLTKRMLDMLTTLYETKSALLSARPLTREIAGDRLFSISTSITNEALNIPTSDLRQLATRIHTLPLQEKERVRTALQQARPALYERIKTGLATIVRSASNSKLMYLRFAFYEDRTTGAPNEPHNMIHLLKQNDKAEIWESLKTRSGLPKPAHA
jgi:hypothetical protein